MQQVQQGKQSPLCILAGISVQVNRFTNLLDYLPSCRTNGWWNKDSASAYITPFSGRIDEIGGFEIAGRSEALPRSRLPGNCCHATIEPPPNQSAACWLRLNHKTTFRTLVRDDAFKKHSVQESRDTQADTSLCPAQVSAGRETGWCIALFTSSVADAAELTGTSRYSGIIGNEWTQLYWPWCHNLSCREKHNLYIKWINAYNTVSSGRVFVCVWGGGVNFTLRQIIFRNSSQERPQRTGSRSAFPVSSREINTSEAQSSMLNSYWWRTNANTNLCLHPPPLEHWGSCIFSQTLVAFYWQKQNN